MTNITSRRKKPAAAADSENRLTVFTAQSKHFFHCRDVICEYVFSQGGLPINPFRAFGYFLGDRVDRDLIRHGNNQLVRICDELWVFGPIADGVLTEILLAAKVNKPVRFFTIDTRAVCIRPVSRVNEIRFEREVYTAQRRKHLLHLIGSIMAAKSTSKRL